MNGIDFTSLIALDKRGIFPYETENVDAFLLRAKETFPPDFVPAEFHDAEPIPPEVIREGGNLTEKLYAFCRTGDRGFFFTRGVGLLGGGCTVCDLESKRCFFLLRAPFARRKKWFCYRRDELLAHELCHVARATVDDPAMEEFFAYQTSFSCLRRAIGDFFSSPYAAIFFLIRTLLLPAASFAKLMWFPQLPLWCFYLLLGAVMGFFAIRSRLRRRLISRAMWKLSKFGVRQPLAVLFRSTQKEMKEISALSGLAEWQKWLEEKSAKSLRWGIISRRFCA